MNTKENKGQRDVSPSASAGVKAALIYAMLFVALMLGVVKTILRSCPLTNTVDEIINGPSIYFSGEVERPFRSIVSTTIHAS